MMRTRRPFRDEADPELREETTAHAPGVVPDWLRRGARLEMLWRWGVSLSTPRSPGSRGRRSFRILTGASLEGGAWEAVTGSRLVWDKDARGSRASL